MKTYRMTSVMVDGVTRIYVGVFQGEALDQLFEVSHRVNFHGNGEVWMSATAGDVRCSDSDVAMEMAKTLIGR